MSGKHFSDTLFDYLFGNIYVSFSEEETQRIVKSAEEPKARESGETLIKTEKA